MHLVTISVRLCMSEYTGNTLVLCPMQTQLFLKSSCPFISYFNRYRPCQIRERQTTWSQVLQWLGGTNCSLPSQSMPSRGARVPTLTSCPHSGCNRWRQWQVTCLQQCKQIVQDHERQQQILWKKWKTFLQLDIPIGSLDERWVDLRHTKGKPYNESRRLFKFGLIRHLLILCRLHDTCLICGPLPYLAVWPWAWPPGRPGSHWLSCRLLWGWGLCKLGQQRPGLPWSPLGKQFGHGD